MNQQKQVKHFTVPPDLFNALAGYLIKQPYRDVNVLLRGLEKDCQAVFVDDLVTDTVAGDRDKEAGTIVDKPDPDEEAELKEPGAVELDNQTEED